jgi:ectoine hydroxylase-related dioxygenase (phytanoyl-CoA dioxygenase family)
VAPIAERNYAAADVSRHYDAAGAHTIQVNVSWQLCDTRHDDGGYVCIPGSNKARQQLPWQKESSMESAERMHLLKHVEMKAGDILIFMGGSSTVRL